MVSWLHEKHEIEYIVEYQNSFEVYFIVEQVLFRMTFDINSNMKNFV